MPDEFEGVLLPSVAGAIGAMAEVVIGVDLGGTNIKAGALGADGAVLARRRLSTNREGGPEAVADRIAEAAQACLERIEGGRGGVAGVGIGSPGTIDFEGGVVRFSPNLPGWSDVPLRRMVADRLKLPCMLENDANAAALAQLPSLRGGGRSKVGPEPRDHVIRRQKVEGLSSSGAAGDALRRGVGGRLDLEYEPVNRFTIVRVGRLFFSSCERM